jgi:hypothetical protein
LWPGGTIAIFTYGALAVKMEVEAEAAGWKVPGGTISLHNI